MKQWMCDCCGQRIFDKKEMLVVKSSESPKHFCNYQCLRTYAGAR